MIKEINLLFQILQDKHSLIYDLIYTDILVYLTQDSLFYRILSKEPIPRQIFVTEALLYFLKKGSKVLLRLSSQMKCL